MKWMVKALIQKGMDFLPNPSAANYFLQSRITRSLPADFPRYMLRIDSCFSHYRHFATSTGVDNPSCLHLFEFGAGYDLAMPLTYAAMGVKKQTIVDLYPHARDHLIQSTVEFLREHRYTIEAQFGYALSDSFFTQLAAAPRTALLRAVGIDYRAPADARKTGLPDHCCDLITNTSTLEHIKPHDIQAILRECHRILKPGGCVSCDICLEDHYFRVDSSITPYNYLRYSDRTWNVFFNSSVHYQNRLRATDYLEIFRSAGFDVIAIGKRMPGPEYVAQLKSLKVADRWATQERSDDFAVTQLYALLQKRDGTPANGAWQAGMNGIA